MKLNKLLITSLLPITTIPAIVCCNNSKDPIDPAKVKPHMIKWEVKNSTWDPERCNIVITYENEIKWCKFTSFHTAKCEITKNVLLIKDTLRGAQLDFTVTGKNDKTRTYRLTWNWNKPTLTEGTY